MHSSSRPAEQSSIIERIIIILYTVRLSEISAKFQIMQQDIEITQILVRIM